MKQLTMTPELIGLIKARLGEDVDPTNFAVFETIALNTKPLPGKRGSLFENAVVMPITLKEMVDYIESGQHIPLIADHEMLGSPKGRMFKAGLDYEDGLEMRSLFFLDETEVTNIAKLNSGSLDEVSVSFLAREFRCSECGWDYFGFGSSENIYERTCANDHKIGTNGVHGEFHGLNQFIELSLVARGAADKPKIVGKSQARLAPTGLQVLAASGFQTDELVVQASLGTKDDTMSDSAIAALTAQLTTLSTDKGELNAKLTAAETARDGATAQVTALTADLTARDATIADLNTQLAAAPDASAAAERDEAVDHMRGQLNKLLAATGKAALSADEAPKTVAELAAKIDEITAGLTAILPVGGVSASAADDNKDAKLGFNASAYATRK